MTDLFSTFDSQVTSPIQQTWLLLFPAFCGGKQCLHNHLLRIALKPRSNLGSPFLEVGCFEMCLKSFFIAINLVKVKAISDLGVLIQIKAKSAGLVPCCALRVSVTRLNEIIDTIRLDGNGDKDRKHFFSTAQVLKNRASPLTNSMPERLTESFRENNLCPLR